MKGRSVAFDNLCQVIIKERTVQKPRAMDTLVGMGWIASHL